jgi:hypothetical protein
VAPHAVTVEIGATSELVDYVVPEPEAAALELAAAGALVGLARLRRCPSPRDRRGFGTRHRRKQGG